MEGYVHSIETCGTVDGPGLRFVLFLQGCPLRCKYCHNPDTWKMNTGDLMSVDSIIDEFNKKKGFYKNGGITVTGGEPLMQTPFVTELFKRCKEEGIHTCLDTSGITYNEEHTTDMDTLMQYVDLIMLDIKHIDDKEHIDLTGFSNDKVLKFAQYVDRSGVDLWVRHVVVPGITQNDDYLFKLGQFLGSLKTIKALDTLPYHVMGTSKYEQMNIPYPLEGVEPLEKEDAIKARTKILEGMKDTRKKNM